MRLAVVTFKVPFDSDKDITASCFSHDTRCFRCKSVSHLPKAWPHYYGWLSPSVIKARVALFRNYANFPAGSPCAAAIHRAHLNAWQFCLNVWLLEDKNIPCFNSPSKRATGNFIHIWFLRKNEAEQIVFFRIHSSRVDGKEGVLHFPALPAEGLIDLVVHRYTVPQLHFHVRKKASSVVWHLSQLSNAFLGEERDMGYWTWMKDEWKRNCDKNLNYKCLFVA